MFSKTKSLIEAHFKTRWANSTPISWDNVCVEGVDRWVRFSLSALIPLSKSIGSPTHVLERYEGVIAIHFFDRSDNGAFGNMKDLDKAADIFRGQEFVGDGVRVMIDSMTPLPDVGIKGDMYQSSLLIHYRTEKVF